MMTSFEMHKRLQKIENQWWTNANYLRFKIQQAIDVSHLRLF